MILSVRSAIEQAPFLGKRLFVAGGMLCFFALGQTLAQKTASCDRAFEQARVDYENGKVFKVIALEDCIDQLPAYWKDDAFYLLFNSYVIIGEDSMANVSMQRLLNENPDIDPLKEDEKFRYFYQQFGERKSEVGLMVGNNFHRAELDAGTVSRGFSLGLVHSMQITPRLRFFQNLIYADRSNLMDRLTDTEDFTDIPGTLVGSYEVEDPSTETSRIGNYYLSGNTFPAYLEGVGGLQYTVFQKERFEFFLLGGLAVNYLMESVNDEGELYEVGYEFFPGFPEQFPYATLYKLDDADHSARINLHYLGGAGLRYAVNNSILFFEARYQRSLIGQTVNFELAPEAVSSGNEFLLASDVVAQSELEFQTNTLTFSFGYLYTIKRFKNLRR